MSEISALLTEMQCNVVEAELWTHNMRVASLIYVVDEATGGPITEKEKLNKIKESLCNVLKGDKDPKGASTGFATSSTHTERRLHQMMFADRDYERDDGRSDWNVNEKITVEDCQEKGYSVVNIQCKNRPKLVFDTLCTLIDMQYVVFHATIDSDGEKALQVSFGYTSCTG
jgi:UTP:GlnB (protein PII) uridylyltransferase